MNALISFKIMDREDLHFRPFAVEGTEGLSQLYKFDIDCFGDLAKRPDSQELIGKRAILRFELEGAAPREVFGIIKTITSGAPSMYGDARYRFQLVPWLERLNYSRASQIHGTNKEVSVVDVIEAELRGGLRRETRVVDKDFRIFEHELRLKNRDSYPKRDHVVQADETDFAFISRMAEHHGIYYFFENADGVEKVVFADDNLFTNPIEGEAVLDWKPWGAGSRAGSPDTIQEFDETIRMIPRHVWMLDYNYRAPDVPLLTSAQIDSHGLGHWVEYGSHHRTPTEGETLARIRAEEMRSHQRRWIGKSAVARLSPGRSFKLHDHPYTDWNQEYLVVSVHHEVRVPMPGVELKEDWSGYRNSFEVIQQKTAFRPARVTPKPRVDGLMNARIDGAGQREKAELDDQGRYRVRVPFDNADTPDGKGSQWVRMATPFGGDGDGMHFPLAPDTEVVIACVNGDPDRPIILGAVPNPNNKNVVTRANSQQNVIATRTGMSLVMGADGGGGDTSNSGGGAAHDEVLAPNRNWPGVELPTSNASWPAQMTDVSTLDKLASTASSTQSAAQMNYLRLNVKNTTPTRSTHNIRMGAVPTTPKLAADLPDPKNPAVKGYGSSTSHTTSPTESRNYNADFAGQGIFIYSDGSILNRAKGAIGLESGGPVLIKAGGNDEVDISAPGEIRLYSKAALYLYSDDAINIASKTSITTTAPTTNIETQGTSSTTTTADETKTILGKSMTYIKSDSYTYTNADVYNIMIGCNYNFMMSATLNVGLAAEINIVLSQVLTIRQGELVIRMTPSIFLGPGKFSIWYKTDTKIVWGSENKLVTGIEGKLVTGTSIDYASVAASKRPLWARLTGVSAVKEELDSASKSLSAKLQGGDAKAVGSVSLTM